MKMVSYDDLARLAADATASERRRTNRNLHQQLDDPIQRLFNAIAPGSYVRPHRHTEPLRWELFLAVRGRAVVLSFDSSGTVLERIELGAHAAAAVEISGGEWHTVLACDPETVLFELKPGPYKPVSDKDFAEWAPAEGDPGCSRMAAWLRDAVPGDRYPVGESSG